jgi:hypothetical protein
MNKEIVYESLKHSKEKNVVIHIAINLYIKTKSANVDKAGKRG